MKNEIIEVPMVKVEGRSPVVSPECQDWTAPQEFNGLQLTRALGRLCAGGTWSVPVSFKQQPYCQCETFYCDGKSYLVCVDIIYKPL